MVFQFGELQEKVMLYAEDTMLLLGDTLNSLEAVMQTITRFDKFSGLFINWDKSALMLLENNYFTANWLLGLEYYPEKRVGILCEA